MNQNIKNITYKTYFLKGVWDIFYDMKWKNFADEWNEIENAWDFKQHIAEESRTVFKCEKKNIGKSAVSHEEITQKKSRVVKKNWA